MFKLGFGKASDGQIGFFNGVIERKGFRLWLYLEVVDKRVLSVFLFLVLVNGEVKDWFIASGSLRHGNHLSGLYLNVEHTG